VCVCVCVCERERECLDKCVYVRERGRERGCFRLGMLERKCVCVCVCVCVSKRAGGREYVDIYASVCVCV
jgi:hypothetical protein